MEGSERVRSGGGVRSENGGMSREREVRMLWREWVRFGEEGSWGEG